MSSERFRQDLRLNPWFLRRMRERQLASGITPPPLPPLGGPPEQPNLLEQPSPIMTAAAPDREMSTSEWSDWLGTEHPYFRGNFHKAGDLLKAFRYGYDWTYQQLVGHFKNKPTIHVLIKESIVDKLAVATARTNLIAIHESSLGRFSEGDINSRRPFLGPTGQLHSPGTTFEDFMTIGVEELHHTYMQQNRSAFKVADIPPGLVYGSEEFLPFYHTSDIEFEALSWKIQFARSHNFDQPVIDRLLYFQEVASRLRVY